MNERNILISGNPGVGKTTLIKTILEEIDKKAGGFYTQEIRRGVNRVGFKIQTLNGENGILAHIDIESPRRIGKYRVDINAIDTIAVKSIYKAIREAELIIIDEIGKMELQSVAFKQAVIDALRAPQPLFGTIMTSDTIFTREIRKRTDIRIYKITPENYEKMHTELREEILKLYQ